MSARTALTGGTTLYLDDAVATGTRPLLPAERAALRRRGAWLVVGGCALLLPAPFLFLGCLAALSLVVPPDGSIQPASLAVLALMLISVPLLLLVGHYCYRRGILLRQDARSGEVYRFDRDPTELAASQSEADWFEVLPASRMVWRSGDGRDQGAETPPFVEVANTPEFAATAAEWTEPVIDAQGHDVHFNHRALAPAELDEVLRHARATSFSQLRVAVPLNLWVGIVLVLALQSGRLPTGYQLGPFLALLGVTFLVNVSTVLGLLDGRKLWRDYQTARVIIVRLPQPAGEAEAAESEKLSPASEYLPFSGRRWTVAGKPDPWRSRGAA